MYVPKRHDTCLQRVLLLGNTAITVENIFTLLLTEKCSALLLGWKNGERKEKKSLKTSERTKASEPSFVQSFGKKVGNIIMGVDIGKGDLATVNSFTQKMMADVKVFGT